MFICLLYTLLFDVITCDYLCYSFGTCCDFCFVALCDLGCFYYLVALVVLWVQLWLRLACYWICG